ncbi:hypothetical protein [Dendronalium sp. ChiSLP03b]|uniref:hypothetical protein n=1 Tax=Dendronalium sp. ChiSLP03b TaxID=3075381 RepID=UPI003918A6B2
MNKTKYFFTIDRASHKLLCFSFQLKNLISYGLLGLIVFNNIIPPTQAQKLNDTSTQSPSTSPDHVAPTQRLRTFEASSCSNSISFSEYTLNTAINSQYSDKGIIFSGDNPFITTDGANPTSHVLSGSPQFLGAIEGTFVDPKDGVTPVIAVNFQLDAGYFNSLGSTTLKLYDSQGKLIEQRTNTEEGIFTFTVEGLPVAKWRIESVGNEPVGFAIDNVCFTLQTVKQSPRLYPNYLKDGDTLESLSSKDFPESEIPQPTYSIPIQSQLQDEENYDDQEEIPDLQTNQDSASISNNAVVIGPQTVAEQSCAGIGTPLTQSQLSQIAKRIRPGASNYKIREAFENFALKSQILNKNKGEPFKSPERFNKTGYRKRGRLASVVPEAVETGFIIKTPPNGGPPQIIPYPKSTFWEAKSIREGKNIELKTAEYQTQGYLDYLSHYSTAAMAPVPKDEHPIGSLVYMTTSDVGVTKGVLDYAGETPGIPFTPVAVYHMIACLRNTNGVLTEDNLQMGYGILLNKNRFNGYPPNLLEPLPAGRPSSLKFEQ